MKIFISADIEGIAGVMRPEQCSPGTAEYQLARGLMEQEVNAAIEGAFAGGATEVVVADSHAAMVNLRAENMDARARLVQGKPRGLSMVEGLEQQRYDGMMFIGYHSAAGEFGVLAHTINGRAFYRVHINGEVMGESDIYAAAGAEQNTPLWLVSGDDTLQQWIARYYPAAGYACVKRAISQHAAESLSPEAARQVIRQAAMNAVSKAHKTVTSRIQSPYHLELMVAKPVLADLFCLLPGVKRQDAITVGYTAQTMTELVSLLSAFSYLATTQN
ncbi:MULTISPECIES: M55 family metallopeptidase [unclassified Brenneria]|uniref:M55 family metallopeptidase n=1 Tax=unclassified Brenneria TaxID=2634434 RepID=UPI001557A90E|nr:MULTISPECIES: M55 family metallopeptidase [unclassified Brenneria]MBJ7223381.1 M55 family metallopeptidase [Brenneria sp. L3-3C-1]MEE3644621.1 M55 family metallopeptidase [Brenneria sp. L3_3C_1]MEE3652184.1 M55 family metallopeptidase [Brenneria sp. HEZEL_4_2_4]NPD02143.1 M55 family metallopeptidase [Brenneria sp. hezel4-2-4]